MMDYCCYDQEQDPDHKNPYNVDGHNAFLAACKASKHFGNAKRIAVLLAYSHVIYEDICGYSETYKYKEYQPINK